MPHLWPFLPSFVLKVMSLSCERNVPPPSRNQIKSASIHRQIKNRGMTEGLSTVERVVRVWSGEQIPAPHFAGNLEPRLGNHGLQALGIVIVITYAPSPGRETTARSMPTPFDRRGEAIFGWACWATTRAPGCCSWREQEPASNITFGLIHVLKMSPIQGFVFVIRVWLPKILNLIQFSVPFLFGTFCRPPGSKLLRCGLSALLLCFNSRGTPKHPGTEFCLSVFCGHKSLEKLVSRQVRSRDTSGLLQEWLEWSSVESCKRKECLPHPVIWLRWCCPEMSENCRG